MNVGINYFHVGFFMTVQIMLGSQKLGEDKILHWVLVTIFNRFRPTEE